MQWVENAGRQSWTCLGIFAERARAGASRGRTARPARSAPLRPAPHETRHAAAVSHGAAQSTRSTDPTRGRVCLSAPGTHCPPLLHVALAQTSWPAQRGRFEVLMFSGCMRRAARLAAAHIVVRRPGGRDTHGRTSGWLSPSAPCAGDHDGTAHDSTATRGGAEGAITRQRG